jgi:hypothetical protein
MTGGQGGQPSLRSKVTCWRLELGRGYFPNGDKLSHWERMVALRLGAEWLSLSVD